MCPELEEGAVYEALQGEKERMKVALRTAPSTCRSNDSTFSSRRRELGGSGRLLRQQLHKVVWNKAFLIS